MARLNDYLLELKIGKNPEIEKIFNLALKQVFSAQYLNKIESTINKRIKIKEKIIKDQNMVAWNEGTNIYINKPIFYAKSSTQQIRYLLHEFMHVLHHSKSFFILRDFKEIKKLSSALWPIVKENTKDIGMFLTGKSINKKYLNKEETVSYLMNGNIKWNQISPKGKQLFIAELKRSNIFNLQDQFWLKRLK